MANAVGKITQVIGAVITNELIEIISGAEAL